MGIGDGLTTTKSNHNWFFFLTRRDTERMDDLMTNIVGIGSTVNQDIKLAVLDVASYIHQLFVFRFFR